MKLNIVAISIFLAVFVAGSCIPTCLTTHAQHGSSGRYSNTFVTQAYEEVASATGVVKTITSGIIVTSGLQKTQRAYISFTGQGVRWVADGSTPSSGLGIPVPNGASIEVIGLLDIQNFKFVNDDDTGSAVAHISLQYDKEMN